MKMQLRILHSVQDDRSKGVAKDQFSGQSLMERCFTRKHENATADPSLRSGWQIQGSSEGSIFRAVIDGTCFTRKHERATADPSLRSGWQTW